MTDPRSTGAYRKARAELAALGLPCWICRKPIDYSLQWPHPRSFSADHVIELDRGGDLTDPANLRPSCLRCNIRRGNYYRQGRDTHRGEPPAQRPERQW
jgi:5-methylcytosine-specific restriction endonuclease McrA